MPLLPPEIRMPLPPTYYESEIPWAEENRPEVEGWLNSQAELAILNGLGAVEAIASQERIPLAMAAVAAAWANHSIVSGAVMEQLASEESGRGNWEEELVRVEDAAEMIRKQEIAILWMGLGKMGDPIVRQMLGRGIKVVGYDIDPARRQALRQRYSQENGYDGLVEIAESVEEGFQAARKNGKHLVVLTSLPSKVLEAALFEGEEAVANFLQADDVVADTGNTPYEWSRNFGERLRQAIPGVGYSDVGVSGGVEGAESGACIMFGADEPQAVERLQPVLSAFSTEEGVAHVGGLGAGHLAKGVHNCVEYMMMQVYAELLGGNFLNEGMGQRDLAKYVAKLQEGSARSYLLTCVERWLARLEESGLTPLDHAGAVGGQTTYEMRILFEKAKAAGLEMPLLEWALAVRDISLKLKSDEGIAELMQPPYNWDQNALREFRLITAVVFGQRWIFGGHDRAVA